jgi:hypothetical protein
MWTNIINHGITTTVGLQKGKNILQEQEMNIEIRKLTPDLVDDYIQFFDITPHSDNMDDHKCYCVCWCNDDYEGKDFSSAEKRRDYAIKYVRNNNIQGYLAYSENMF